MEKMSAPTKEAIEAAERLLSCAAYNHLGQSRKEVLYVAEHFQSAIDKAIGQLLTQLARDRSATGIASRIEQLWLEEKQAREVEAHQGLLQ